MCEGRGNSTGDRARGWASRLQSTEQPPPPLCRAKRRQTQEHAQQRGGVYIVVEALWRTVWRTTPPRPIEAAQTTGKRSTRRKEWESTRQEASPTGCETHLVRTLALERAQARPRAPLLSAGLIVSGSVFHRVIETARELIPKAARAQYCRVSGGCVHSDDIPALGGESRRQAEV